MTNKTANALVVANLYVPDSHSFQHFLDGSLPKMIQSYDLILPKEVSPKDVKLVVPPSCCGSMVGDIFSKFGFNEGNLIVGKTGCGESLVFTCNTPPIHPYLWKMMQKHLKVPFVPMEEKSIILYLQRTRATAANGGRNVLNEAEFIPMLESTINKHNQKFTKRTPLALEIFNHKNYPHLDDVIDRFKNVKAIIGPHGGAFYNQMFACKHTLIIEFVPVKGKSPVLRHPAKMIWVMGSLLEQNYYMIPIQSSGRGGDMTVPVEKVEKILVKEFF